MVLGQGTAEAVGEGSHPPSNVPGEFLGNDATGFGKKKLEAGGD